MEIFIRFFCFSTILMFYNNTNTYVCYHHGHAGNKRMYWYSKAKHNFYILDLLSCPIFAIS